MTTNKQLRELAENATQGDWELDKLKIFADTRELVCCGGGSYECCGDPVVDGSADDMIVEVTYGNDAAFIAAANPVAVLALLDEIEALQAECEKLVQALRACAKANAASEVGFIVDAALTAHRKQRGGNAGS